MTLDLDMAGFAPKALVEHVSITHPDLKATNTAKHAEPGPAGQGQGRLGQGRGGARQASPAVLAHAPHRRLSRLERGHRAADSMTARPVIDRSKAPLYRHTYYRKHKRGLTA